MVHAQAFFDQFVLQGNHVRIVVLRKVCVHAVTGLAGFSVTNIVGQDDEIARRIQQLARPKQHTGKDGLQQSSSVASRTVKDEDGIGGAPAGVLHRLAQGGVMQSHFGHGLTRLKVKIVDDEIAFLRRRPGGALCSGLSAGNCHGQDRNQCNNPNAPVHRLLPRVRMSASS